MDGVRLGGFLYPDDQDDVGHIVASELKDPICHSDECQIGFFSTEETI